MAVKARRENGVSVRLEYDVQTQTWMARINGTEYRGASHHSVVGKVENYMRKLRHDMTQEVSE